MTTCPRCGCREIEFDLAADARIFLSFWTCPACGQRGVSRLVDRKPEREEPPRNGFPGPRPALRAHPPARAPRRPAREGRSRA